jgi:hypothetical protein
MWAWVTVGHGGSRAHSGYIATELGNVLHDINGSRGSRGSLDFQVVSI